LGRNAMGGVGGIYIVVEHFEKLLGVN